MRKQKLLVFGSFPLDLKEGAEDRQESISKAEDLPKDNSDAIKFQSFCEELGKSLSSSNYDLYICSLRKRTADYNVAKAASEGGVNVILFWAADKPNAPDLTFVRSENVRSTRSGLTNGLVEILLEIDLVVLIGGIAKTGDVAPLCHALGIPYVPIPNFGGLAAKVFEPYSRFVSQIDPEMARALNILRTIKDEDAKQLVAVTLSICDKARKSSLFDIVTIKRSLSILALVGVAVLVAVVPTYLIQMHPSTLYFFGPWIGGVITGTVANYFVGHTVTAFTWKRIWSLLSLDVARAMAVSIVLFAALLIMQIPIAGEMPIVTPSDYVRVSMLAFLLAFGAAWYQERVLQHVRTRIESFLG